MYTRYITRKFQKKCNPHLVDVIDGMKIDLCTEFDNLLNERLHKYGVSRKNINDPAMDYFRLMHRIIEKRPRRIEKAKDFYCPPEYIDKLKYIEKSIIFGKNIMPFTTRTIKDLKKEDLLLSDWGIYHFHISNELDMKNKDGFMARSKFLLMVRIDRDCVYFIKVISHKEKNVWSLKEYIQVVRDNWKDTIERYRLDGIHSTVHLDDEGYLKCRNKHMTTLLELDDGSTYICIGGGYASNGSSNMAVSIHDFWYTRIEAAEQILVENWKRYHLENKMLYKLFQNIDIIEVHLITFWDDKILLRESNTELFIELEFKEEQTNISFKSADQQFPLPDFSKTWSMNSKQNHYFKVPFPK